MSEQIKRDDGGPAFPSPWGEGAPPGMTLRDYFAIHAPTPPEHRINLQRKLKLLSETEIRAALAYEYADAMLAERRK